MRTLGAVATRIRILVAGAVILAVALCAALVIAVRSARGGLDLIGHHSGPVVVATSDLYYELSEMDTQVANVLLVGDRTDLDITRAGALERYEDRRRAVDDHLRQIATFAGGDAAAQRDLGDVMHAFGRYQALAAQAILAESQAPSSAPGRPPAAALDLYRQATDLMHDDLLPAAQRVVRAEVGLVDREYARTGSRLSVGYGWVAALGLALLGILVALQVLLARAHHRVLNPAIAVATLATFVVLTTGMSAVSDAEDGLDVAKRDSFDYTVTLHQARAVSYDAYGDQGRYLLDPARRNRYESAFYEKSQQLVRTDATTVARYDAALAYALNVYFSARRTVAFDGFLGRSLRHVAFTGELAAGENALRFYQTYQAADRRLRTSVANGDLVGAIRSYTGQSLSGANATLVPYLNALGRLIEINEWGFDGAVSAGRRTLHGWGWRPPLLAVGVAVLLLVGAAPRLAEYRG
jgi:hypothetical protein